MSKKSMTQKELQQAIAELNKTGGAISYSDGEVDPFGYIGIDKGKIWASLGNIPHYVASAKGVEEREGILIAQPHAEDVDRKRRLLMTAEDVIFADPEDIAIKVKQMRSVDEAEILALLHGDTSFNPETY